MYVARAKFNVQICKSVNVQICKSTNVQIRKSVNLQMCKSVILPANLYGQIRKNRMATIVPSLGCRKEHPHGQGGT